MPGINYIVPLFQAIPAMLPDPGVPKIDKFKLI